MGLLNVVVEIVTRWLMLEAHSFCCVDSVQSGSALLIGVMQALRGKLKVAALQFRISRTEMCVHSWNYTRAGSLHFGQGVRAVTCGLPRCLCHVWTGSTKRVVAGMTRCMHVCSWFVPVRWMYLDFLDFHGFDLASGGLESVKKCRKSSPSAWTPFFFFSDGKEMVRLGKPGNALAVGKLFQMATWLISTSFLQLESILGQELHPGNQAFKCRLRRKEIACMPFGLFLLKIAHTNGNWCPASANRTFSQRWGCC